MSLLHQAVPGTTAFLPRAGTPALPLPVWFVALDGWLAMADFELEETLVDADRNRFLLELLGAEGR
ncbi:MAG: hypothetical protein GY832_17285 [Chloroflexi bacterium]|nr:hypothetical protein [Chloroflexota bacterium]